MTILTVVTTLSILDAWGGPDYTSALLNFLGNSTIDELFFFNDFVQC